MSDERGGDGFEKAALAAYLPATVLSSVLQMHSEGRTDLPQSVRCVLH